MYTEVATKVCKQKLCTKLEHFNSIRIIQGPIIYTYNVLILVGPGLQWVNDIGASRWSGVKVEVYFWSLNDLIESNWSQKRSIQKRKAKVRV